MPPQRRTQLGALASVLGGALWVPYGVFEMLEPWGAAKEYREDVGYSLVTDPGLFVAYSTPGALALLLATLALLTVISLMAAPSRLRRAGQLAAYAALGLALLSAAGVAGQLDPLFTAARIFGTLALGAATLLVGLGTRRAHPSLSGTRVPLLVLGVMGMLLLPLWPVVYAMEVLPEAGGAAFIALFGAGWAALGIALLLKHVRPRPRPGHAG